MRSVSRPIYGAGLIAVCGLLAGGLTGCATTQETAELKQVQSKRILDARADKRKQSKSHDDGSRKR